MTSIANGFDEYISQPDQQTKIWHYMDFTKYLALLQTRSLFLCQVTRLDDKYEGSQSYLAPEIPVLNEVYKALIPIGSFLLRKNAAVSCWHINDDESAALWKIYVTNNEGVAIQTTVERLIDSLAQKPTYRGQIIYGSIDWKEGNTSAKIAVSFFNKRPSFKHEQEYRIVIQSNDSMDELGGVNVSVTLDRLIENVYIAPSAAKWFAKLVEEITVEKYGL